MSRTFKDQPHWVRAQKTGRIKNYHHRDCEEDLENHGSCMTVKCIDERPAEWYYKETIAREYNFLTHWYEYKYHYEWVFEPRTVITYKSYFIPANKPCDMSPNKESTYGGTNKCRFYYDYNVDSSYYRFFYHPSKEDRRDYYYKPERQHTRNSLNEAKKDYNTNGDTDIEPIKNRNPSGPWLNGYWD